MVELVDGTDFSRHFLFRLRFAGCRRFVDWSLCYVYRVLQLVVECLLLGCCTAINANLLPISVATKAPACLCPTSLNRLCEFSSPLEPAGLIVAVVLVLLWHRVSVLFCCLAVSQPRLRPRALLLHTMLPMPRLLLLFVPLESYSQCLFARGVIFLWP